MPKGVEHVRLERVRSELAAVRIPMMPKGVEHWPRLAVWSGLPGENSDDAERR